MLLSIVLRRPIGDGPGDDTAFDRSVISESLRESLVERAALMRRACFSSSSPQRPRKESFGSRRRFASQMPSSFSEAYAGTQTDARPTERIHSRPGFPLASMSLWWLSLAISHSVCHRLTPPGNSNFTGAWPATHRSSYASESAGLESSRDKRSVDGSRST